MCGFVGVFDLKVPALQLRPQVLSMSKKIRHRGPDWSGIFSCDKAILAHERLSIVDPESGQQPLYSKDGKLALAVNGEIYNHLEIRNRIGDSLLIPIVRLFLLCIAKKVLTSWKI
jgi:asparagine synthase (glutamine-hydrolysing)